MHKNREELNSMSREERIEYFKGLSILELKKYFGIAIKNPVYGELYEVYLDKIKRN